MNILPRPTDKTEAILLDVGGVVLSSAWEILLQEYGPAVLPADLLGPFSQGSDRDWRSCLSGDLTEHEYWDRWTIRLRDSDTVDRSITRSDNPIGMLYHSTSHAVRVELLPDVQDALDMGLKVVAVSNGVKRRVGLDWFEAQELLQVFSDVLEADAIGARKPSELFFRECSRRLATELTRIDLVDDNPHYAAAAMRLGLQGHWCKLGPAFGSVQVLPMARFGCST